MCILSIEKDNALINVLYEKIRWKHVGTGSSSNTTKAQDSRLSDSHLKIHACVYFRSRKKQKPNWSIQEPCDDLCQQGMLFPKI